MKTALTELIEIIEANVSIESFTFWKNAKEKALSKERQDIIDAYFDGTAQFANDAEIVRPLKAEDYFTQKYKQ